MKFYCAEVAGDVHDCPGERDLYTWFTSRRAAEAHAREYAAGCERNSDQRTVLNLADPDCLTSEAVAQVWQCEIRRLPPRKLAIRMTQISDCPGAVGVVVSSFEPPWMMK